jgi:HD-like signal output (HDOD) protein
MTTAIRSLPEEIRNAVTSGQATLPPLPAVAARIRSLLQDSDRADARVVADLIHADPAIAAVILRMSNSVAYVGLRPIADLTQAVARLGLHRVGSIVTAVGLKDQFEAKDPARQRTFRALWDHAIATAIGARHLAGGKPGSAEEAFLAGLLHDTGKLLVLKTVEMLEKRGAPKVTPAVLDELMEVLHPELGHHCLSAWKLPPSLCAIALHHHDANAPASNLVLQRVQVANALARKIGAHPAPAPDLDLLAVPAVGRLELGESELASLSAAVETELATLKGLL